MDKDIQSPTISDYYTIKYNSERNVVIQSALDHWTDAIIELLNIDTVSKIKVVGWKMTMSNIDNEVKADTSDYTQKRLVEKISDYSTTDFLHIFVAPITWAAKHRKDGHFVILGPAFGSNSDIGVYARKKMQKRDINQIKIGIVDDDITSNVLFQLYHLLLTETFNTNIYEVIEKFSLHTSSGKDFIIDGFEYEPSIKPCDRLRHLIDPINDPDSYDFAIFTDKDISIIKEKAPDDFFKIRKVLKIDPIISHFFDMDYTPRSVYCIHESQYTGNDKKIVDNLISEISSKTKQPINYNGIFSLNPKSQTDRNVQSKIIKISKSKGILKIPELIFNQ